MNFTNMLVVLTVYDFVVCFHVYVSDVNQFVFSPFRSSFLVLSLFSFSLRFCLLTLPSVYPSGIDICLVASDFKSEKSLRARYDQNYF